MLKLFLIGLNEVLESFGNGLEFEYYNKETTFLLHNRERTVTFYCKKNVYSGRKYYMCMLPKCNEWIRYYSEEELNIKDQ